MDGVLNPLRELQEAKKALQPLDPFKELRETMKVLQPLDPFKELREAMKALQPLDPFKELRETMKVLQPLDPFKQLRETLHGKAFRELQTSVGDLVRAINVGLEQQLKHSISNSNLSDEVVCEAVSVEEVRPIIEHISTRVAGQHDLASLTQTLLAEIRAIKDTRIQRAVALFVVPLLVSLIMAIVNPVAAFYLDATLRGGSKRAVEVTSEIVASSLVEPNDLARIRMVDSDHVKIRSRPKKRGEIISTAQAGQIVVFMKRCKKWALVGFSDIDGRFDGYGWVRSKSLVVPKK